ncbi:MAG: UbiD family decarboxylase [Fibrobacteraceae bacterium]|nr:UbiD family decarboxylase [Fibrobacteraceae bacterium]
MYTSLKQALLDLEKNGMLKRVYQEVDPNLEMAAIAQAAYAAQGPALLFEKVKGSRFSAVCNLFGTEKRTQFLFRHTIESTKTAVQFKSNPIDFFKTPSPAKMIQAAKAGISSLPKRVSAHHMKHFQECALSDLPQIKCWPMDGGAFLTLPQVASRPSENSSIMATNVGMYRIQISGNDYILNKECGLHYQIKRDIARHHQKALEENRPLKVSIFLGGPPAHTMAAIMPMPENLSELIFAGMLSGRRFRYFIHNGYIVSADADFCILGEVAKGLKPEGPFGDHVGYYSGCHDFPYLKVYKVLCKKDAIYPFTVVGRPPQEDTSFGQFIHQITKPMVPASLPGVCAVHAVDAAGVHPLCLALGSESFKPFDKDREPMELLKTANALLGFNQVSLTKYLMIAAKEDAPNLDVNHVGAFFAHMLERIHFNRDLHFQTSTTVDTLDYTGSSLNHGSKLVLVAAGSPCRTLRNNADDLLSLNLPKGFDGVKVVMEGILAIQGAGLVQNLAIALENWEYRENYPWISIVDKLNDIKNFDDFLWITFTRSDPAKDVSGVSPQFCHKHFTIASPMIVDARIKPHHQKPLERPLDVEKRAQQIWESIQ